MQVLKEKLPQEDIIAVIAKVVQATQKTCYLVGGYVRDSLLGKSPKDIDIVSIGEGSGTYMAKQVARCLPHAGKVVVHENFGTAQLSASNYVLEFVTARRESYRRASRNPSVVAGSFMEDQKRRDFTINALAVSLNDWPDGTVIDNFNGLNDLQRGIIRTTTTPAETFEDDPLRMLRAIRFATQLDFSLSKETFTGIESARERIAIVSQERITDELNKIILSKKPSTGFLLLFQTGLLAQVFPEMHALQGVEVMDNKRHKDNFYHTLTVLDNISEKTKNLWLRWAAILHDIAKPLTRRFCPEAGWTFHGHEESGARMTTKIFKRLRLSLSHSHYVKKLVRLHLRPIALVEDKITDAAVRRLLYEAGEDVEDLMTLCRADVTSKNPRRAAQYLSNFDRVEKKMQVVEAKDKIRKFQPPITGSTIMTSFGIGPQPVIGVIKEAIKHAILDGKISNDFEAAYAYMLVLGKEHHLAALHTSTAQKKTHTP